MGLGREHTSLWSAQVGLDIALTAVIDHNLILGQMDWLLQGITFN